jgi:hypothetical protein
MFLSGNNIQGFGFLYAQSAAMTTTTRPPAQCTFCTPDVLQASLPLQVGGNIRQRVVCWKYLQQFG